MQTKVEVKNENENETQIKDLLKEVLETFPGITVSMIQVAIGTRYKPNQWKPIFHKMIHDGEIQSYSTFRRLNKRKNEINKYFLVTDTNNIKAQLEDN